jgi:uncharacterized membrane protein YphA (DoxX/SURF4 family)
MRAARAAVAAVWLYEGLWCKVFAEAPDQRLIVASVPGLPLAWVTAALVGLGVIETAVGLWVLSGVEARTAAYVQTGLLVLFNAGGLLFAGARIAEPGRMLTQNAVLLAVIWLLAGQPVRRHADG